VRRETRSRLAADLEAAAAFGGEAGGGVTRLAWTTELFDAYDWLAGELRALGLHVEIDAAGNLVGRWRAGGGGAVVVGSHLDTVRHGGRFDGTLGVLAGLEAIRLLQDWGVEPAREIRLVAFMDEEGTRFGTALFGSRAYVGEDVAALAERQDSDGINLREAMAARGRDLDRTEEAAAVEDASAYLELHIEQGPVLERAGVDVGVVTAITGVVQFRARFAGEANHAGTTPMDARRDALAGAARAVLALREEALRRPGMTANVGHVGAEPGGANVVPGAAELTIDARAPTPEAFAELEPLVRATLEAIAAEEGLELELHELFRLEPLPLDEALLAVLEAAAAEEGATTMRLPSGAGHDAMVVGRHVPAAMLFAPSRRGISHSPEEYTPAEQCERAARVLARALRRLVAPA
jgi:hydantoinase/carbamoylase family amidase